MRKKHTKHLQLHPQKIKVLPARWGRKFLILMIITLSVFWVWQKFSNPQTFPIEKVDIIDASHHVDHALLKETITPYLSKGMLMINLPSLTNAIAHLSWVENAAVSRKLPKALLITITEKKPIAQWNDVNILDDAGDVFAPELSQEERDEISKLPSLHGPKDRQNIAWNDYQQIKTALLPLNLFITHLDLTESGGCTVSLSNHIKLILDDTNLYHRITEFSAVYPRICQSEEKQIDYIDLRYSNGFAVHWKA